MMPNMSHTQIKNRVTKKQRGTPTSFVGVINEVYLIVKGTFKPVYSFKFIIF